MAFVQSSKNIYISHLKSGFLFFFISFSMLRTYQHSNLSVINLSPICSHVLVSANVSRALCLSAHIVIVRSSIVPSKVLHASFDFEIIYNSINYGKYIRWYIHYQHVNVREIKENSTISSLIMSFWNYSARRDLIKNYTCVRYIKLIIRICSLLVYIIL